MITVYGITTCDSVKKTRKYLENHDVDYEFIDFKKKRPTISELNSWWQVFGDKLMNKHSKTYRENADAAEAAIAEGKEAILKLLSEHPLMIKRPVVEKVRKPMLLGWNQTALEQIVEIHNR